MGIGAGIVRRFVAEGASVAICDIAGGPGAALAAELGGTTCYVHLDVSNRSDWARVMAQTEAAFGPLNILVNNAGIGRLTYVENMSDQDWAAVLGVNLNGVIYGMQAGIPSLRRGGNGSIINISSLQGIEADVGLTAYVATKFAVRGITKSAALELGRDGIRANSIHPGMIRTPAMGGDYLKDDFFGSIPLKRRGYKDRAGYPEDVGGLASFLASDGAGYITGAEFIIDGGKSIRFATTGPAVGSFST